MQGKPGFTFSKLMVVYVLWLLSWSLAASLFEVYFFNLGLSLPNIYFADTLWFFGSLLAIPLFRGFRSRNFMLLGIALALAATSVLYFQPTPAAAFAFRLIIGLTNFFFWAPFNTLFYEYRKGNNAVLGAVYYAMSPLLSLITPALAGLLATSLGFPILYTLSMALFGVTLVAAFMLVENKYYSYTVESCIRAISGLRTLIFMEGFAAAVLSSISLSIMLLLFANTPASFGIFTSLVTVFAVLASILMASLSDKFQRRREFILPVVALFSLSAIFASQSHDLLTFFIAFGLVNFFSRIFFPLPFALVVDNSKSLVESMVGREIYLNLGRLCGGVLGYLLFISTDISTVVLFQAITLLAYIPIFENRKRKLSTH